MLACQSNDVIRLRSVRGSPISITILLPIQSTHSFTSHNMKYKVVRKGFLYPINWLLPTYYCYPRCFFCVCFNAAWITWHLTRRGPSNHCECARYNEWGSDGHLNFRSRCHGNNEMMIWARNGGNLDVFYTWFSCGANHRLSLIVVTCECIFRLPQPADRRIGPL